MQIIDGNTPWHTDQHTIQTIGFFDGVHLGHKFLLQQVIDEAHKRNLKSMVVTFRQHPRKVLHPESHIPLLTTLNEKLQLIEQSGIDYVALLDFDLRLSQMDAHQYMEHVLKNSLHSQALVIGYDHHFGKRDGKGFAEYKQYGDQMGIDVIQAKELPSEQCAHASSTAIRKLLEAGDIAKANKILGRPYSITGSVAHGQAIGRSIGFPTANITPNSADKLIPQNGVYATLTHIGTKTYKSMLYIGSRPTIDNQPEQRIEANLFDFNEEIYGQQIHIDFVARTRGEQRFSSLDQLQAQLTIDKQQVESLLK